MRTDDWAVFSQLEAHLTSIHRLQATCLVRERFSSLVQRFTSLLTRSNAEIHRDTKPNRTSAAFAIAAFLLCVAACPHSALGQKLQLTNPLNVDRTAEVVEVPLTQVMKNLRLTEAKLESLVAID